jgi:hypothetical protein
LIPTPQKAIFKGGKSLLENNPFHFVPYRVSSTKQTLGGPFHDTKSSLDFLMCRQAWATLKKWPTIKNLSLSSSSTFRNSVPCKWFKEKLARVLDDWTLHQ